MHVEWVFSLHYLLIISIIFGYYKYMISTFPFLFPTFPYNSPHWTTQSFSLMSLIRTFSGWTLGIASEHGRAHHIFGYRIVTGPSGLCCHVRNLQDFYCFPIIFSTADLAVCLYSWPLKMVNDPSSDLCACVADTYWPGLLPSLNYPTFLSLLSWKDGHNTKIFRW